MKCQYCGAEANGAFCEYCGSKMPVERVETQTVSGQNVTVNNYYYAPQAAQPEAQARQTASGFASFVANTVSATTPGASPKSRGIALLLCFFFGYFGVHRFYVGRYLMGLVYLFTFGGFGFAWLADIVLVLLGKMKDRDGLPVANW